MCIRRLSYKDIEQVRNKFYGLRTETAQNQYVIDYLHQHSGSGGEHLYTVGGIEICEKCWRFSYGLRIKRFSRLKQKFSNGTIIVEHGRYGLTHPSDATIRTLSWMDIFFKKIGDQMPTKKVIHLPSCLTKADVYGLAFDDLNSGGLSSPSPTTFYRLWQTHFTDVVIPKVIFSLNTKRIFFTM